ncbi:MAG: ABC transporter ATP-binding protein [Alphaproteobacteria bacterium]|nr:ABC transporter ATP-binding protein [Alphaproteobacteria bacterium]
MDHVLSIRNLTIDFDTPRGRVHALRDVSLEVPHRKIVGIVGESGCGKSTLISAALGLLASNGTVRGGEVLFEGKDILKMSQTDLRSIRGERISMVFQDPMTSLNPVLSVAQLMTDIQYRHLKRKPDEKRARAIEMLRQVGIPDPEQRIDHYPFQFSGGMRQRIAIAMALITNPSLLIADEPTTALDVTLEAQIIHLLRELHGSKFQSSIAFVSHNLGLIAEMCDEVVVMYAGEVIEQGSVRDLFHRPSHPYTQALLTCDPARIKKATRELPTIPGDVPNLIDLPQGCVFRPRCPKAFEPCGKTPPRPAAVAAGHEARCFLLAP